ncbi:hypothetical protein SAMN03159463_04578 [Mesorhizobium sp. NFR06]|nr:hypothetical protein SAMN03159463_04578 [Mesorhizobium sp. NFR06]
MEMRGFLLFRSVLTTTIAALTLGPSFAHVLESLPRLTKWSQALWGDATVFNTQFQLFAVIGAPLDIAAILCPALLARMLRRNPLPSGSCSLPPCSMLSRWRFGSGLSNRPTTFLRPGGEDRSRIIFEAVRLRWETGHMAVTAAKALGFISLCFGLLRVRSG